MQATRRAPAFGMAAAVIAVALSALGSGPPAAAAAKHTCSLRGSKTVRRLGHVRVYRIHHRVYGCSTRYGRRVRLARAPDRVGCFADTYAQDNDTVLAIAHDASVSHARLSSWSLQTGKRLREYTYQYDDPGCGAVYRLVTNATGSLAWIALSTEHENGGIVVEKDDAGGFAPLDYQAPPLCDPMTADCGDTIDTSYLTASGGMVFWKANGTVKSAPFN